MLLLRRLGLQPPSMNAYHPSPGPDLGPGPLLGWPSSSSAAAAGEVGLARALPISLPPITATPAAVAAAPAAAALAVAALPPLPGGPPVGRRLPLLALPAAEPLSAAAMAGAPTAAPGVRMLAQLQAHNRALQQEVAREIADAQELMASLQVGGLGKGLWFRGYNVSGGWVGLHSGKGSGLSGSRPVTVWQGASSQGIPIPR